MGEVYDADDLRLKRASCAACRVPSQKNLMKTVGVTVVKDLSELLCSVNLISDYS